VVVLMVFRNPEQVRWQIQWLLEQGVHVVLHVDAKFLASFAPLLAEFSDHPGVSPVSDPVRVNWAGFSQVRAVLAGVKLALDRRPSFSHLHVMSGECLPLQTFDVIEQRWAHDHPEADLIESRLRPGYEWRINRFNILGENPRNREHWHNLAFKSVRDLQIRWLSPRKNFRDSEVLFGSQWWSLRAASLRSMLLNTDLEAFIRMFRWTRCADEHFFQILHHRAGLRAAGNLRYDDFPAGHASPRYLDPSDLLAASDRGYLYARKVSLEVARTYWREA
jgi:hypothetical protein